MRKTTKILTTAFTMTACLALSGCGKKDASADALARIQEKGEIVVAMEGTWAPWTYHDESDNLVGYDVEVSQAIAEKLGVKASFVEGEWDGLLAGLDAGRYDIVVNGIEVTEERAQKYDFTEPYAYIYTALIVKDDNTEINSFEDLAGKTTANSINSTYMMIAEDYGATVSGVDSLDQTFDMVLDGRVDATLNAEVSYYDYLRVHADAPLRIAALADDASKVSIPVPKGEDYASLKAAIDQAITELREDGTLTEISEKYFGSDLATEK